MEKKYSTIRICLVGNDNGYENGILGYRRSEYIIYLDNATFIAYEEAGDDLTSTAGIYQIDNPSDYVAKEIFFAEGDIEIVDNSSWQYSNKMIFANKKLVFQVGENSSDYGSTRGWAMLNKDMDSCQKSCDTQILIERSQNTELKKIVYSIIGAPTHSKII